MVNRHLMILTGLISLIALSIFYHKSVVLDVPLTPGETVKAWTVETRVSFDTPRRQAVKVGIALPHQPRGYRIVDETFVSNGYGVTTHVEDNNRISTWAIRRASGKQSLYYQAQVISDSNAFVVEDSEIPKFPSPPQVEPLVHDIIKATLSEVRAKSADIQTFTSEVIKLVAAAKPGEGLRLLIGEEPDSERMALVASQLLTDARIPSRLIYGLVLDKPARNLPISVLLQTHNGKHWLTFDPISGQQGMPTNYLVWSRNIHPLGEVKGGKHVNVEFSSAENVLQAVDVAQNRVASDGANILDFSLLSLPIQAQSLYRVLLTVPVGAFLIVLLRNVGGIKTFGTFAPVLIALAFRETQLITGLLLFSAVILMGLAVRFYFEKLKLLMVPRLAAVLIVVLIIMSALSVMSFRLGLEFGLTLSLFPMVVMAMMIERMSIVWEEFGPGEAFQQAGGSLFGAILGYLVMNNPYVEHLVFVFPELLLVMLALVLLMGRYTGYRITELYRFRDLAKP